jgi:hypothetical protein
LYDNKNLSLVLCSHISWLVDRGFVVEETMDGGESTNKCRRAVPQFHMVLVPGIGTGSSLSMYHTIS